MRLETVQRWRTPLDEHGIYDVERGDITFSDVMLENAPVHVIEQQKDRLRYQLFDRAWKRGFQVIEEQWDISTEYLSCTRTYTLWMLCERRKVR